MILVLDVNLTAGILSATLFTLIADKKAEFETIFNQKKEEPLSRLRSYESLVNQNLSSLDAKKKELDARVEQAKQKGLEDALKGLFRR